MDAMTIDHLSLPQSRPIMEDEARGDSRAISAEEFQSLAAEGKQQLEALRSHRYLQSSFDTAGKWERIKERAFQAVQSSWGGLTVNARTGQSIDHKTDQYAISVKWPGQDTVSVPENSNRQQFYGAMETARRRFSDQLRMPAHHLGVFRDDDNHRIDIDPVIIVKLRREVDAVGAYTHAVGGAYHFATGAAAFPPHVKTSDRKAA